MSVLHRSGEDWLTWSYFSRNVTADSVIPICLLGEGTFHQIHGGIATSGKIGWDTFNLEYETIFGHPYTVPQYSPIFAGPMRNEAARFNRESFEKENFS